MTAGRINQVGTRFILPVDSLIRFGRLGFQVNVSLGPYRFATPLELPNLAVHRVENFALETTQLNARERTLSGELRRRRFLDSTLG